MKELLVAFSVLLVIFPLNVQSQPHVIDEATMPGYVLLTENCPSGPLVLENADRIPWKFFRVNTSAAPSYSIVLNQRVDTGERSTNCLPKEPWAETGFYKCENRRSIDVRVGQILNAYPPTFCNKSASGCNNLTSVSVSVKEDVAVGFDIVRISMCDMDIFKSNSELHQISIGSSYFSYGNQNEDAFTVHLNQPLDYETATQHRATLTVDDGQHKPPYTMELIVNVVDVDDQGPAFSDRVLHCRIAEGMYTTLTASSCVVLAKDQDLGINDPISYRILTTDTGKANFSITDSGTIMIQGHIDRETHASYILPVKGYQRSRESDRFDIVTVIMEVTDVNDNLPAFTQATSAVTVVENTPDNTVIYQFAATDPDEGTNAYFTYHLEDKLGAFKIDNEGRLSVKDSTLLDRETHQGPIHIKVFADPGGRVNGSNPSATLTITLTDVNDNSPQFEQASYDVTINKTHRVGAPIISVTANDPDSAVNGKVMYSIINENFGSTFSIDNDTGKISLQKDLSEYFSDVYHLVAKAEDQADNLKERRSSSVPVTVHVKDVNIHTPTIVILDCKNVSENAPPGTPVAWLNVTDKDPTDIISVQIVSGNVGVAFEITQSYFSVYSVVVISSLDRETTAEYHLQIEWSDSVHKVTTEVFIYVLDENDNHPVITEPNSMQTTENLAAGSFIGTVTVTDADFGKNADLSFNIDPESPWNANFSIDPTSGRIQLKTSLDRDVLGNTDTLHFLVYAVDHGDIPLTGSSTITVTILDVNDNAPVFERANVTLTVTELQNTGVIFTTKATDMDYGENKKISYSIGSISPPITHVFEVSQDGQLMNKAPITFNDSIDGVIKIEVVAKDNGKISQSSTQIVILQIQDVNNHVPTFPKQSYEITINETTEPGSALIRISASDMDRSALNNKITYWLSNTYQGIFRMDSATGEVFLVKDVDLDVALPKTEYTLEVIASDMMPFYSTGSIQNTSVPLTIHVEHVNEYAPVFEKSSYTCSIDENVNGSLNCFVNASDPDSGLDGKLYYDVIKTNILSTSIRINNTTGQLYLMNPFDYESLADKTINITVSARDSGYPLKVTYSQVTVDIRNVNDNQPRFIMRSAISISENIPLAPGLQFFALATRDADGDLNYISYEIKPPSDIFIVHNEKSIVLNTKLRNFKFDYENTTEYTFNVFANDSKHTTSKELHVRVMPMNEFAPIFVQNYSLVVPENSLYTHQLQAADKDTGALDGKVSYVLDLSGINHIPGQISVSKTGLLTIVNLDKESVANFSFTALAVDGGEPALTGMTTVHVVINGTDDNPPFYSNETKNITLAILEGKAYTDYFKSKALDKDIGYGSEIVYELLSGNNTMFQVSTIGMLSISPLSLNDGGEIQIQAYNPSNRSQTAIQIIHIDVQDVNDHSPQFGQSRYDITILETTEPGTTLTSIFASDMDTSPLNNKVSYWLNDTYQEIFRIDSASGEVVLVKSIDLDVNSPVMEYVLQVISSDMQPFYSTGEILNTTVPLTIRVKYVNEYAPAFDKSSYECSINENVNGPINFFVQAHDADHGLDGQIHYDVVNNITTSFKINRTTGQLYLLNQFDYETLKENEMNITISASDSGTPPKVTFSNVRVVVLNVNDCSPNITTNPYIAISEGVSLPPGQSLFELTATDRDGSLDHLSYDIRPPSELFTVQNDRSIVMNPRLRNFTFDYENTTEYKFTVYVNDSMFIDWKQFTVQVTPINEFTPVFKQTQPLVIPENSVYSHQLQAVDDDKGGHDGTVSYALDFPGEDIMPGHISITKAGMLSISNLDRETVAKFSFTVLAIDGGKPSLTGMTTIQVIVNGTDDNSPYYTDVMKHVNLTLDEGKEYKDVFTSMALDKDIGYGSEILYETLSANKTRFHVSTSGMLSISPLSINDGGEIQIQAYNPTNRSHSAIQIMKIVVQDVNNHSPHFEQSRYNLTILETTEPGTTLISISASDLDTSALNNKVLYWLNNTDQDIFRIEPTSGEVVLAKNIDLDVNSPVMDYVLQVISSDMQPFYSTGKIINTSVPLTIHVEHVNEYAPVFDKSSYECSINENVDGPLNCFIQAHDADKGPDGQIYYDIVNNMATSVKMNQTTGQLYLLHQFDYETLKETEINITISASDNGKPPKVTRSNVRIVVNNINDCSPNITTNTYIAINEGVSLHPGQPLFELTATDRDGSLDLLSYDIRPPSELFKVQNDKSIVLNPQLRNFEFDYENTTEYKFTVFVNDSINVDWKKFTVQVTPMNEFTPVFKQIPSLVIPENSNYNIQLQAVDEDKGGNDGDVSYELDLPGKATIHGNISITKSGMLTMSNLDKEKIANFSFTVLAIDGGKPSLTGMTTIQVVVNGTDDNSPYYTDVMKHVNLTLDEGKEYNDVFTSMAFDKDIGYGSEIRYQLLHGNGTLVRVSSDGRLSIQPLSLYDGGEIRIQAFNPTNISHTAIQTIRIDVKDVNDHLPQFENSMYITNISEITEPGTPIIRIHATDSDASPSNSKVTYWSEGSHAEMFRIDPLSGEVFLVKDVDVDEKNSISHYLLEVFASDMQPFFNGSQQLNISVPLVVDVTPVNEYNPTFSQDVYVCSVNESYTGTFNCSVLASDRDSGEDGHINYHIINNSRVKINKDNGEITIASALHFANEREITVNVSAMDGGHPSRITFCLVKIEVILVNIHPPMILWNEQQHLRVTEEVEIENGTQIGTIPVEDIDGNDGHSLKYSFKNNHDSLFHVNDGIISLMRTFRFDFETKPQYTLELLVQDDVHQPVTMNVTLDVININEYAPVITSKNFTVVENSISTVQIMAYDADGGEFGRFSFKLLSDVIKDNVSITDDGNLTITNLDREKLGDDGVFVVPVAATDRGNLTGTADIIIKVIGVNDLPPYYLKKEQSVKLTVEEKTVYNGLFTSEAYDNDIGEGSTITYRLKKGNDTVFKVDSSGVLSIHSDKLSDGTVDLEIEAFNPGVPRLTAVQKLTLTVLDINDNVPQFTSHSYNVSIDETTEPDSNIINVTAVDTDSSLENNKITYWLTDTYRGMFRIDTTTGEVFIARSADLDVPIPTTHYPLQVFASDMTPFHNGSMTFNASAPFDVYILHSNEYAPKFDKAHYECTVEENYEGPLNCFMQATDQDSGPDGHITYSVVNSSTNHFRIDQTTGQINLLYRLDYENPKEREFNMTISARDHGTPPKAVSADVRVVLTNLNDNAPVFNMKTSISFSENFVLPQGMVMFELGATDRDGDIDHLSYEVKSHNEMFVVHDNKTIILNPSLQNFKFDYETTTSYTLTVSMADSHYLESTKLNISITPVNEFKPVFKENYTMFVPENSVWTGTIQAEDLDAGIDGKVFYALEYPEQASRYGNITVSPGGKLTISNLDREAVALFTFVALATDGGNPAFTGMTTIEVVVQGVDDNPPYYREREKHMYLSVKAGIEYIDTFTSVALDDDIGFGSSISYRLSKGNQTLFTVSPQGQLSIRPLSPHDGGEIQIEAFNPTNPTHTAIQTVKIIVQ